MARGYIDQHRLVDSAVKLFREKGYHSTTMEDIANACHIQKASLYHHIPSRKVLVIRVVEFLLEDFRARHFAIAFQDELPAPQRLKMMAQMLENFYDDTKGDCPIFNIAIEAAYSIHEVKSLITTYFTEWVDAITHVLNAQYSAADAKKIAEETVAHIQGILILRKLYNKNLTLKRATHRLATLLDTPNYSQAGEQYVHNHE